MDINEQTTIGYVVLTLVSIAVGAGVAFITTWMTLRVQSKKDEFERSAQLQKIFDDVTVEQVKQRIEPYASIMGQLRHISRPN
jgi:hypothetical protein